MCRREGLTKHALTKQVEAKGQDADILQAIEARLAPVVSKVASEEEAEAFAKMHAVSALVVLTGSSGDAASAEHQALQQAATQLRGKVLDRALKAP